MLFLSSCFKYKKKKIKSVCVNKMPVKESEKNLTTK